MANQSTIPEDLDRFADEDDAMRDYDAECERIREKNAEYLALFERALKQQGLADNAIHRHVGNVDFFLNDYLLYDDANEMESGCSDVGGFLGDFFIRKCTWSSPTAIKENAASIKAFYQCMRDNDLISESSYEELAQTIEEDMDEWQAACSAFDGKGADLAFLGDEDDMAFYDDFDAEPSTGGLAAATTTREDIIQLFTLALMYLNSKGADADAQGKAREGRAGESAKPAEWDALEALRADGLIADENGAASLALTDAGVVQAETFLYVLGLGHLLN